MEQRILYFEKPGRQNTEATLQIARERATAIGIAQIVLATNHGYTAQTACRIFANTDVQIVAVTISAAYGPEGWTISPPERDALEAKGVKVVTCQNALSGGVCDAMSDSAPVKFVRQTLYAFGQGMKVAVEVAIMAAESGALDMNRDIIAIGGSGEGADTAIVISPVYAREFPKLRIREILAKPRL